MDRRKFIKTTAAGSAFVGMVTLPGTSQLFAELPSREVGSNSLQPDALLANKIPVLSPDSVVERLIPDPGNASALRSFSGFLGHSERRGYWRLYASTQLDEYLEIPSSNIRGSKRISQSQGGGISLWVDRDANIEHVHRRMQAADFLEGEITERHFARAVPPTTGREEAGLWDIIQDIFYKSRRCGDSKTIVSTKKCGICWVDYPNTEGI